jgi:hypothetical protein
MLPPPASSTRLAVAALVAFFFGVGLAAIAYGDQHWDEKQNVANARYMIESGAPFPGRYFYGGTLPLTLVVAAIPDLVSRDVLQASEAMFQKPYRLRARALLLALSSLVVLATFLLARALGRRPGEALFATGLVATSWALITHARFIAPDGILAALTTGAMAALASSARAAWPRARLVRLAIAAALVGVAAGAKYSAGILLVAVVVECARGPAGRRLRDALVVVVVCGLGFVLTTPGAIFEPDLVIAGLRFQAKVYGGGWVGYTVDGPAGMARTMLVWLAFAASSPFRGASFVLLAFALWGAVLLLREHLRRDAATESTWTPWLMPALFVALFLFQNVFLARNFHGLIPFVAILAAAGLGAVVDLLGRVGAWGRWLGLATMTVVVLAQAAFNIAAAESVANRSVERTVAEVARFVSDHPDETFLVSPAVKSAIGAAPNVVTEPSSSTRRLIALPGELFVGWEWPSNDPFLVDRVIGPQEIDWVWYTGWFGPSRAVVMSVEKARRLGASLEFSPHAKSDPPSLPAEELRPR